MDLIERYLTEVGHHLPKHLREDVRAELGSSLRDAVEDRAAEHPERSETEIIEEVLRELGPPAELAEAYLPEPRHLIGPDAYPAFVITLKIALAVIGGLLALGLVSSLVHAPLQVGRLLLAALPDAIDTALGVFAVVVLIFAGLERLGRKPPVESQTWEPTSLPEPDDPDRVSLTGQMVKLVMLCLVALLLNLYPGHIVAFVTIDSKPILIPIFGAGLQQAMPLINLWLAIELFLTLFVIRQRRRSFLTRSIELGTNALFLVILVRLLVSTALVEPDPVQLLAAGLSSGQVSIYMETLAPVLDWSIRLGLGVGAVITLIECITGLRRLLRG